MTGTVDYMEVMGVLGGIAMRHPQSTSLLMQTFSLWNTHSDEVNKTWNEYQVAAAKATGPMDQAGIVLQLMAAHPNAEALLKQTFTMWQTRIPDLIQILDELQNAANEAMKT